MLAMGWCNRRSGADCGWLVKRVLVAASALEAMICFVTFLVAIKPVKPCDESVFEALYLLPKIGRMQQARVASGLRFRAHRWI